MRTAHVAVVGAMLTLALIHAPGVLAQTKRPAKRPVCCVDRKPLPAKARRIHVNGKKRYFCRTACFKRFLKTPERYAGGVGKCHIQPSVTAHRERRFRMVVNNDLWYFC